METDWIMHSILVQKYLSERTYLVRNFKRQWVLCKKNPHETFSYSFFLHLCVH